MLAYKFCVCIFCHFWLKSRNYIYHYWRWHQWQSQGVWMKESRRQVLSNCIAFRTCWSLLFPCSLSGLSNSLCSQIIYSIVSDSGCSQAWFFFQFHLSVATCNFNYLLLPWGCHLTPVVVPHVKYCTNYVSSCCDQMPNRSNTKEEGYLTYCSEHMQVIVARKTGQ